MCLFKRSSTVVIPPPPPSVPANPEPIQAAPIVEAEAPVFGDQGLDGLRGSKAALRRRHQQKPAVDTSHVGLGIPSIPKTPATGGATTSKRPQIPRI